MSRNNMSHNTNNKQWWENTGQHYGSKTTVGHGTQSQFAAEFQREWIHKENRRRERGHSPERPYNAQDSLHRNSLHQPFIYDQHTEHMHRAKSPTLHQLKTLQTATKSQAPASFTTTLPSPEDSPKVTQPLQGSFLPHLVHHAHLGWNAPTPQARYAICDSQTHARHGKSYGLANKFNQDIHFKHAAISSRRA